MISVDDYLMMTAQTNQTTGKVSKVCYLGILPMDVEYWLIGDVFLRGYYSIFDNSNHEVPRLGFAPHATSSKPKVVAKSKIPAVNVEDVTWELTWIFDLW